MTSDAATSAARPRHFKRARWILGIGALVLSLLVGVALAFFITDKTFANNAVAGGNLTVTADDLPLDFNGDQVFPTDPKNPDFTVKDNFSLTNENPVTVSYLLSAKCGNCGTGNTPQKQQFDNLFIRIKPASPIPGAPAPIAPAPVYQGKLADLQQKSLGNLDPDADQTFDVEMWLGDNGQPQPQGVQSLFDLIVSAKTPVPASPGVIP
jgi:hypothetical protein